MNERKSEKWDLRPHTSVYVAATVLALGVLIQATIVARLRFYGTCPNLLLVVVVTWSLLRGIGEGMVWGFAGGLASDLISGLPLGTSSLALMLVSLLPGIGEGTLFQGNIVLPVLLVILATPLFGLIVLLSTQVRGVQVAWGTIMVSTLLPELALNTAVVTILYPLLRWLAWRAGGDRMEW